MRDAIEQVHDIDFAWQRWEASREEARITREYNNFIELRRLYWEERMEFIRDYLQSFFIIAIKTNPIIIYPENGQYLKQMVTAVLYI